MVQVKLFNNSQYDLKYFRVQIRMEGDVKIKNLKKNQSISFNVPSDKKITGFIVKYDRKWNVDPKYATKVSIKPRDANGLSIKVGGVGKLKVSMWFEMDKKIMFS